ncbi:MAG: P22AR C-terminal domain-containing protein [[Pasteurella] mairii]|uniref:Putative anti-repressor protein n=1 Tax=[Pasteurella] mairii TaxID=757 RepID=A0A379B4G4_9PAST|nr:P22AR C-terminal domain-containing protein [[Pasteurella] mairii]SUB28772.1 putative anti-repressor protein [[Pasteurella] mairii]SUB33362.1 putative anti-repressor protein [[Pasteurella] mairii]
MTTLTFQTTNLSVINHNNQIWFNASEIGRALDYKNPIQGITLLFNRYQDEFTPSMTALIDMQTAGGVQKVRIFSLRGTHLIAMLSHTKVAKDFRKWVLDILDKESQPQQLALPEPEKKYSFDHTEQELQAMAWEWFALFKCVEFTNNLIPALDSIQSTFAARAHGIVSEYGSMLRRHQPLIQKLTADFHVETWGNENWNRVLPTIRDNDILRPKRRLGGF